MDGNLQRKESWWSDGENLANLLLIGEAYVDPSNPILTLVTKYDIEEGWDFGFVQVSTNGGETWTSLENPFTTYDHAPDAHPDISPTIEKGFVDYQFKVTKLPWLHGFAKIARFN